MRVQVRARARVPLALIVAVAVVLTGCRSRTPQTREVDVWKGVGNWSGHGNLQTETFTSDTGGFRVTWETRNEQPPGTGAFKVVFHSNDSGRPIIDAVEVHGIGHATIEVADIVRWYYVTVESANVDWSLTIDERLRLQLTPKKSS